METENNTGKKKQRRSTPAERAEMLEEFHRSGLTRIAFSRMHNVALSTLSKWLFNSKRKSKASAPVLFLRRTLLPAHAGEETKAMITPSISFIF